MIASLCVFMALLAVTHEQNSQISPCPDVFMYEPPGTEPDRWYGIVNLSTDSTLHSLWLNIELDSKADMLGNWLGEITTKNNKDFRIENAQIKINPGHVESVRFFVKYDPQTKPPGLEAVRLNGREICKTSNHTDINPELPKTYTEGEVKLSEINNVGTTSTTTIKPYPELKPEDIPQTTSVQPTEYSDRPVYVRPINSPSPSSIHGLDDQIVGRPISIPVSNQASSPVSNQASSQAINQASSPAISPASNPVNNYNSNNRHGQNIGGVNLYSDQKSVLIFVSNTQ